MAVPHRPVAKSEVLDDAPHEPQMLITVLDDGVTPDMAIGIGWSPRHRL
jgi:hypothetical protein